MLQKSAGVNPLICKTKGALLGSARIASEFRLAYATTLPFGRHFGGFRKVGDRNSEWFVDLDVGNSVPGPDSVSPLDRGFWFEHEACCSGHDLRRHLGHPGYRSALRELAPRWSLKYFHRNYMASTCWFMNRVN